MSLRNGVILRAGNGGCRSKATGRMHCGFGMDKMENTQRLAQGIPFTMEWQNKKIENFPVNNHALPVFRKEISLKKKIKSASAFVCGLGQFEFFLNGKKVSNHFLKPAGRITTNMPFTQVLILPDI